MAKAIQLTEEQKAQFESFVEREENVKALAEELKSDMKVFWTKLCKDLKLGKCELEYRKETGELVVSDWKKPVARPLPPLPRKGHPVNIDREQMGNALPLMSPERAKGIKRVKKWFNL